jgi:hypothetical protein
VRCPGLLVLGLRNLQARIISFRRCAPVAAAGHAANAGTEQLWCIRLADTAPSITRIRCSRMGFAPAAPSGATATTFLNPLNGLSEHLQMGRETYRTGMQTFCQFRESIEPGGNWKLAAFGAGPKIERGL